jgi:aminobenzoyl-glutamate utilization protein B
VDTANGAALGTGTQMSYEVMHGNYSLLPNETLQKVMQAKLEELGGVSYSAAEQKYAETIYKTLVQPSAEIGDQESITPYQRTHGYGSTDVGDVSWLIPTGGIGVATWVPGTAAHSWQAVSTGGTSIGLKGTKLAAKALAATALEIYENPRIVDQAKKELQNNVGPDFKYQALLGDRKPPLNYRNN